MQINTLSLALATATAAWAVAAPELVNIENLRTTHSITQVPAGPKAPGWKALAAVHAKYGKEVPSVAKRTPASAASAVDPSVGAQPGPLDEEYLSPVSIGPNNQTFFVQIDTGSSDFWVFSDKQPADQRLNHSSYHLTGNRTDQIFLVPYTDRSVVQGSVYIDKVVLGGLTATSQAVEAAESASPALSSDGADGVLGLGPYDSNRCIRTKCQSWFTTVLDQLKQNLFAVTLKKAAPGTFDFGFIDPSKYVGDLQYANVTSYYRPGSFWEITAAGYSVGNANFFNISYSALVDTGTSLILLAPLIAQEYYKQVPGAKYVNSSTTWGYQFPCSAKLPNFSVYFRPDLGSVVKSVVPGSYLNHSPLGGGICYGALQDWGYTGLNVLGVPFFQANYVVFDNDTSQTGVPRIGFAQQKGIVL